MGEFFDSVYELSKQIPKGRVTTYGALAKAAGKPGASRAAAQAMARNPFPGIVPCHRVVMSDGSLGGFSIDTPEGLKGMTKKGRKLKIQKLAAEGVKSKDGRVADFDRVFFDGFDTSVLKKGRNKR